MARFSIGIIGNEQLERALKSLPEKLERAIIRKALRAGANLVLPVARARAPRGMTGRLASTIRVRALKRSRRRIGLAVQTGPRDRLGIGPYPNPQYYYPTAQEIGWTVGRSTASSRANLKIGRGKFAYRGQALRPKAPGQYNTSTGRRKIRGKQFLRGAYLSVQGEVLRTIGQSIGRDIERTIKDAAAQRAALDALAASVAASGGTP